MSAQKKQWSVNPIEVAIFSAVALIGANSFYSLIRDADSFQAAALSPMSANPISEKRSPASIDHAAVTVETNCNVTSAFRVTATKVSLSGPFCPEPEDNENEEDVIKPQKVEVKNESNDFVATVFIDPATSRFSTDYIPLSSGTNEIRIQFVYPQGKPIVRKLELIAD